MEIAGDWTEILLHAKHVCAVPLSYGDLTGGTTKAFSTEAPYLWNSYPWETHFAFSLGVDFGISAKQPCSHMPLGSKGFLWAGFDFVAFGLVFNYVLKMILMFQSLYSKLLWWVLQGVKDGL